MSALEQEQAAEQPYEVIGRVGDPGWHERRATGIGASEAAIVLGVHARHGEGGPAELWAAKSGRREIEFDGDEELAHWGLVLEQVIIDQFATERYAGWEAWPAGEHLRSKAHPWALATLDGWTRHPTLGVIPLECKTVQPWIADQWFDSTPVAYWWQVQHQLLVTGARAGAIAALVSGGRLMWELITRDEPAQAKLAKAGAEFWKCVEEDRVPLHVPTLRSVAALYPPGGESGSVQISGSEWVEADRRLQEIKVQLKTLGREKDQLEAQIKNAIADHAEATLDGGVTYTYRTQSRAEKLVAASTFRVLRRKAPKGE